MKTVPLRLTLGSFDLDKNGNFVVTRPPLFQWRGAVQSKE
jgi:hypothetical protein